MGYIENLLKFILTQDPINIAIGMSLGVAFSKISLALISDIVTPIIHLNISEFKFGNIIEQLVIFIIFIIIFYSLIVKPINKLKIKYNVGIKNSQCPYCFTLINSLSTKCSSCTSLLNSDWYQKNEN